MRKDEEVLCCVVLREAYMVVFGAIAWIVLTRAELAVYVHALRRRAHAPRISDCKRLNIVIEYVERHKCGFNSAEIQHH